MSLNGADVRNSFDRVTNGVKYAIDYARKNFKAEKLANLPFTTLLVPLPVFFAVTGNKEASATHKQRISLNNWFWRASFSRRYSSGVLRNLNADIEQASNLRDGKASMLGEFAFETNQDFFTQNSFGLNNVNTKTFILMLASQKPRSFISGAPVDLAATLKDANRTEFHHMMPKSYVRFAWPDKNEAILANFCFLSRSENRELGGVAPSEYRKKMPAEIGDILTSAVASELLFQDDYIKFVEERAVRLAELAQHLCNQT